MSSKPSKPKRKLEWVGIDDSFGHSKKPRITASNEQFGSLLDFTPPQFEQASPAAAASTSKAKGKAPAFSLHSHISDFSIPSHQHGRPIQTPARHMKHEAPLNLTTPKTPRPPLPFHRDTPQPASSSSSANTKNWVSLADVPPPVLQPAFEPTPSTPKGMQSAFRTPLIPGTLAFTSPPASQELDVPLSQILGARDMSPKRLSANEMVLSRGLAPSPVKGGGSPKKTFVRGGLADRAKLFMTRSTTDFSLWYQDVSSATSTAAPSLRVRVKEVVCRYPSHEPAMLSQSAQSSPNIHFVLTRCQHLDTHKGMTDDATLILFKSSIMQGNSSAEGARKKVADASIVAVGRDILLWQPWTEVSLPLQGESEALRTNVTETAILCTRFLVK
ncbi:hypothetical protein M408DRAFT_25814 [Serendipita vermifera MAFF 305830]|uniref:Uncharacterized protein n=1 Tax=Serendipita vermifera MAFF 305830 TaxID=933852 RepID=A0A0C3B310_SERVB|nr:hypothetical protein M408DRAFT_25814 [Serendipita vermifera MAFF 305830]